MPPVTRRQSEHSVIDLTEDDILPDSPLLPDSPPRPTIASRQMAPRRALRSGSTSTTASTLTRTSGSRTEGSTTGDAGSTGQLTRSSSGSSIVALAEPPEGMIFPASKRQKLNKGKGRATSTDILAFDEEEEERRMLGGLMRVGSDALEMEEEGGVIGEPEENLLASFQCPICLAPPIQAVLTPCGHVTCGACLFSTLKTQAIRERRPPNLTGSFPTAGPGVKKPRGKADTEAWYERYGADRTGKIRGKILTGSCPVSSGLGGHCGLGRCGLNGPGVARLGLSA